MIGVLIIAHYNLGQAFEKMAEHFFGKSPDNLRVMGIGRDSDPESMEKIAKEFIAEIDEGKGVLILSDVFGATPANIGSRLTGKKKKVAMVSGLNVAMLVRALNYSANAKSVKELADLVKEAGEQAVKEVLDPPSGK